MIKKISVALFMALLLLVFIHKTVAAELTPLPVLTDEEESIEDVRCENINLKAHDFAERIFAANQRILNYLILVSGQYSVWYKRLSFDEGKYISWPSELFAPIEIGAANMSTSSEVVYAINGRDEEVTNYLQSKVESCAPDSVSRDQVIESLQKFLLMNSEHLSSVADFLAQMYGRLGESVVLWRRLEGRPVTVPLGYFKPLDNGAKTFTEAAALVGDNSKYVEDQYVMFMARLGQTFLPLARR
ncbi:MAG: hypothetical protein A2Z20_05505 [Bdellovibrionales bacterium RBG_16_40_8]|nr:MAG: hypothetical protein A2Z20_05505 [Bdellovibrionales bacterium RBG_16_40_8]